MTDFEPMRDFFHRRQAKILTDRSAGVRLVTVREEAIRDCFAFPGTEYDAGIEIDGQHVGRISYGINPLNDRVYIYELKIERQHQLTGTGISVLWLLWCKYQIPLVPMSEFGTSKRFWSKARERLAAAGSELKYEIRSCEQSEEQQRWKHLIPETPHERRIRDMKASPEWPEIEAGFKARQRL